MQAASVCSRSEERSGEMNMRSLGSWLGLYLALLLSRVSGEEPAECAELETCDRCTTGDASLNLTDCVWVHCESETFCIAKDKNNLTDCTVHSEPSMCEAITTTKEAITAEADTTSEVPTTAPVYSPSSFDPASFIGGMVLVLGAEAAFFFAIKFFKARDGTYQTLI
ncbi:CD164 sialomucin-like 2 protein isoform X3 [Amblyraja radiata]|uniref:CD164 sialomucin-like 2 protein isoform X3 n=1 Tax=Amblyraja radiata TaxID=386614 RepID=UPI0014030103|nr:CD164 sialomucin-like 2 protein isoform X3 [Amblyraja radiata]